MTASRITIRDVTQIASHSSPLGCAAQYNTVTARTPHSDLCSWVYGAHILREQSPFIKNIFTLGGGGEGGGGGGEEAAWCQTHTDTMREQ